MRWAFTRSSETVKQPVLFYALVWFSHARGPDTLIGGGKSPFHPRSRCSVSAWVLDLLKKKGWFTGEKVSFLWSTIYPANFDTFNGLLELVPSGISPFLVFFWPNEMISYWTLCSLRSTSYKIIVPHTQLAIKWFIQMTKTLKTLFFFICYHPFPRQPAVKVQSFEPKGWGYSEGGQIKTNFSLFSFVYVCQCVRSSSGRVKQYRRLLLLFVCLFFFEKVWVSGIFCWYNVSQVLYIFYINYWTKQHICARRKVPGWELRPFLCALWWGIDRQVRDRW